MSWSRCITSIALLLIVPISHAEVVEAGGRAIAWSLRCDGYLVKVPEGWILDNKIAASQGVDMFFLPKDSPRALSNTMPVFAYVMPTVKAMRPGQQASVQGLIDLAVQDYKRIDSSTKVEVSQTDWALDARDRKITLVHISAPAVRKYDAIAYDEDSHSIFAITVTAKDPKTLSESEEFLKRLTTSAKVIHSVGLRQPCHLP